MYDEDSFHQNVLDFAKGFGERQNLVVAVQLKEKIAIAYCDNEYKNNWKRNESIFCSKCVKRNKGKQKNKKESISIPKISEFNQLIF